MRRRLLSAIMVMAMLFTMIPENMLIVTAAENGAGTAREAAVKGQNDNDMARTAEESAASGDGEDLTVSDGDVAIESGTIVTTSVEAVMAGSSGDDAEVTRLEWLAALVETFEMTVSEDNYPDNYYSDIVSSAGYYRTVMVATEFGLVDVEAGGELRPNDVATREFSVHSLNLCLGYQLEEDTYTFAEAEEVTYPKDIQIAIDKEWFTLTDDMFLPQQALTASEKNALLSMAKEVYESTQLDENHENTWELEDGVIDLTSSDVQVSMTDEDEYTLQNCTQELKTGDIYAVLISGIPVVRKVKSLIVDGTTYVVQTESVAIEEAFASIDIQGHSEVDLTQIVLNEATTADVQVQYISGGTAEENWADGTAYDSVSALGNNEVSAVEITQSFAIPKRVQKKYDLADGVTANVTCIVSDVWTDYDIGFMKAYFQVNALVTFDCNVSMDVLDAIGVSPSIELVKVPLPVPTGYFKVNLDLTMKGNVALSLIESVSVGISCSAKDGFRFIKDFHKVSFTINAHAEASAGFLATADFDITVLKGEIYVKAGAKSIMDAQSYDDGETPTLCTHINAWMYLTVGGSAKFDIRFYSKSGSFKEEIYNQSNSPVRVSFHYEDGKAVSRCTREDAASGSNKNTSDGRWKYYTPATSQYGYNGSSSGLDADGKPYTIFTYYLKDDNAIITGYRGKVSALSIPDQLDGYPVVEIADKAFQENKQLRAVLLPDSVVRIGSYAFSGCTALTSVKLSKGLKSIGNSAFADCDAITSIEIPKSLEETDYSSFERYNGVFNDCNGLKTVTFETGTTRVASNLFACCHGLEKIVIPDTITSIDSRAFYNCKNLKDVTIPDSVLSIKEYAFASCGTITEIKLPNNLTELGKGALQYCSQLKEIIIPDSIETINAETFVRCTNLSSVKLPKGLKSIGYHAFEDCYALASIEIPKSLEDAGSITGVFRGCKSLKTVKFETGTTRVVNYLFSDCPGLEAIVIPDTVTTIGSCAFENCQNLKEITIPDTVTTIGSYTFSNCQSLKEITIPDTVTSIGWSAFSGCQNLEEIAIPDGVTSIGIGTFSDCTSLHKVSIPDSVMYIEGSAFASCSALTEIRLPDDLTKIDDSAFQGCIRLKEIAIPDSVERIGDNAFSGCTDLTSVKLPKGLNYIGASAFKDCNVITGIEMPKRLMNSGSVGSKIFEGCGGLKTVTFEDGATNVISGLFTNCPGLEELVIPDTVTCIGESAFENCQNLKSITIPNSVTDIEKKAFFKCICLKEIIIPDSVTSMGYCVFSGCAGLEKAVLPDSGVDIELCMFQDCTSLKAIEIPDSVKVINGSAFRNCESLENVTIGSNSGLRRIEDNAFQKCKVLKEIELPDTVTYLGSSVFAECDALTDVTLSMGLTGIPSGAFQKCVSLQKIIIPYRVTGIGQGAFSNCRELTEVVLPRATKSIASDAFSYPAKMTIYGVSGTYAETYAGEIGATFVAKEVPVTAMEFNKSEIKLFTGASDSLVLKVTPADFTDAITWRSSNTSVATVTAGGTVNAVAAGTATISALAGDTGAIRTMCSVEVLQPVQIINLNKSSLSIEGGETFTLTATILPLTANDKRVEWSSSDETIATVSQEGVVTALHKGACDIVAKALDGSNASTTCKVTVNSTIHIVEDISDLQSTHPYANNTNESWVYTVKDAEQIKVTFSPDTDVDDGYDFIYIYDGTGKEIGKYTGNVLADQTVSLDSDTVKIKLVTDSAIIGYGFRVLEVVPEGQQKAAQPEANEQAGEVIYSTKIELSTQTEGASIYYTLDGSVPSAENSTLYEEPIEVTEDVTIKAISVKEDYINSDVGVFTYKVAMVDVVFDSQGGTAVDSVKVPKTGYVQEPVTPSKAGYVFAGWYLEGEEFNFKTPVTQDITLVAMWKDRAVPVSSINLNKTSLSMEAGESFELVATVDPDTASDKSLEWRSSDETIATVSEEGVVTALQKGTTTITVSALDGSKVFNTCDVTVNSTVHVVEKIEDLQSQHPYANNTNEVWIYTLADTDRLSVSFSTDTAADDGFDFIYIYDSADQQIGKYTGKELAGESVSVEGSTVKIRLASDDETTGYGFRVTAVVPVAQQMVQTPMSSIPSGAVASGTKVTLSTGTEGANIYYTLDGSTPDTSKTLYQTSIEINKDAIIKAYAVKAGFTDSEVAAFTYTISKDETSVALDKQTLSLKVKETAQLTATVSPDNAIDKSVAWSSSDDKVATADTTGKVTAVAKGTAIITVTTIDGHTATCIVTVTEDESGTDTPEPEPEQVSINTVVVKQKLDITGKFTATTPYKKYSVTPKDVATVTSKGILTAKKSAETVTVVGLVKDGKDWKESETIIFKIENPAITQKTITATKPEATFDGNDNITGTTIKPTSWISSKPAVAEIDAKTGVITTKAKGSTKITAVYGEGKNAAKYTFSVKVNIPVMSKTKATALTGATLKLKLKNVPKDKTSEIKWASSDSKAAEVDSTGKVTVLAYNEAVGGKVAITATIDGIPYPCEIEVKKPELKKGSLTIKQGKSKKAALKNTKLKDVTWTSSDTKIATVDENGKITAVAPGKTTIRAAVGGVTCNCELMVE